MTARKTVRPFVPASLPRPWRKACCPVCFRGMRSLKVVRKHAKKDHGYTYPQPLKPFQEAMYPHDTTRL